jgi:hypothetical protein
MARPTKWVSPDAKFIRFTSWKLMMTLLRMGRMIITVI